MTTKNSLNYDAWLSGHAKRKTMMEKLERSLVPYELFRSIPLRNDRQPLSGDVTIASNTYHYEVTYDYNCIGHEVYDAVITAVDVPNRWENLLMGYNRFKVVLDRGSVITIYSDHEDYFQQVIDMFERDDYASLYLHRSAYINNLLARYMILRMVEEFYPDWDTLCPVRSQEDGNVTFLAASPDRKERILYAFDKHDALEMAKRYDGCCADLKVIYFFNRSFEYEGNNVSFDTGCTRVVSARSFYRSLPLSTMEKRWMERRMLLLISLLYNEHLEWHEGRIVNVVENPPVFGKRKLEKKRRAHERKEKMKPQGRPWYERVPRTLLEDALNVLEDEPRTHSDIFHYLAAGNLMNAYVNQCKAGECFTLKQVQRMYQAKQTLFRHLLQLRIAGSRDVRMSLNSMPALLVTVTVDGKPFQFSFRGMTEGMLEQLHKVGVRDDGSFDGFYLQPIAAALYKYSCLLRWKGL